MIKHIVMWTFKDSAGGRIKSENINLAAGMLSELKEKIETVRFFEIGQNINRGEGSFDLVLYSEFDDVLGLETYQKHPEHLKVVEFLREVRDQRIVVDYKA